MPGTLKALGQHFQPKESEPDTTPSLRDALKHPAQTVGSYYVTPSIRSIVKEVLETVVHGKGQGYWVRAEYGAGKTLASSRLAVLSDLLNSQTLATGLRAKEFRSSYESYREALESLDTLPLDDEERDAARRIIGTLIYGAL